MPRPCYGSRLSWFQQPVRWETQFSLEASPPFGTLVWRNDLERFRAGALRCQPDCRASLLSSGAVSCHLFLAKDLAQPGKRGTHPSSQLKCHRLILSALAWPGGSRDPPAAPGWGPPAHRAALVGSSAPACQGVPHSDREPKAAPTAASPERGGVGNRPAGVGISPSGKALPVLPLHCDSAKQRGGGGDDGDGQDRRKQRGSAGRCAARGGAAGSAVRAGGRTRPAPGSSNGGGRRPEHPHAAHLGCAQRAHECPHPAHSRGAGAGQGAEPDGDPAGEHSPDPPRVLGTLTPATPGGTARESRSTGACRGCRGVRCSRGCLPFPEGSRAGAPH